MKGHERRHAAAKRCGRHATLPGAASSTESRRGHAVKHSVSLDMTTSELREVISGIERIARRRPRIEALLREMRAALAEEPCDVGRCRELGRSGTDAIATCADRGQVERGFGQLCRALVSLGASDAICRVFLSEARECLASRTYIPRLGT